MAVVAHLARQVRPLVDFIYPPRCPACGIAIAGQEGLCTACWGNLAMPDHAEATGASVPVYAATYYNATSRTLVLAYKHGGRLSLGRLLARLIAARLPAGESGSPPAVLVPVPLHRWRLWSRGFNQAALLAQELARMGKGEAVVEALVRKRRTPHLGGLGRKARERVLSGAIALNARQAARLRGRHVVLIDDVLTSGATSRACIAAITEAGPASIAIACFARVEHDEEEEGLSSI